MKNGYIVTFEWLDSDGEGYAHWESGYNFVSKLEDLKKYYKHLSTQERGWKRKRKVNRNIKVYKVEEINPEDLD